MSPTTLQEFPSPHSYEVFLHTFSSMYNKHSVPLQNLHMVGKEKQFAYSQESTWVKASLSLCCRGVYDIHVNVHHVYVYLCDVDVDLDAYRNSDITVGEVLEHRLGRTA